LPKEYEVLIKWKMLSKDFKDEGELKLIIQPEIEMRSTESLVNDPSEVRIESGEIEDVIVETKD
jgi:hypothetical protein